MMQNLSTELEHIRGQWGWYLALGVLLVVLGMIALGFPLLMTLASMIFLGWLLIISGFSQAILAFQVRRWGGVFLHVLAGVLEIVVGFLILRTPGGAALVLTLLAAAYLLVGGLFRMVAALALWFPGAGWVALGGLVSTILGLALAAQWPVDALWFIGFCVGVDLVLHGMSWTAFALAARKIPSPAQAAPPADHSAGPA